MGSKKNARAPRVSFELGEILRKTYPGRDRQVPAQCDRCRRPHDVTLVTCFGAGGLVCGCGGSVDPAHTEHELHPERAEMQARAAAFEQLLLCGETEKLLAALQEKGGDRELATSILILRRDGGSTTQLGRDRSQLFSQTAAWLAGVREVKMPSHSWLGYTGEDNEELLGRFFPRRQPEEKKIAARTGWRKAPASLLLAIAQGLATERHWWLASPSDRKSWDELPAPASMTEVEVAARLIREERGNQAPCTGIRGDIFEWRPWTQDTRDRKITIRVPEGASQGTIEWSTGKSREQGDEWACSAFVASVLVVLPGAEDNGVIGAYIQALDTAAAQRAATVFEAQKAGVRSNIVDPATGHEIASAGEMRREAGYFLHLGHQPRRSYTYEGEERRFARWLRKHEFLALVQGVTPLPWKAGEDTGW